jgi:hypothetical protein
MASASNSRVLVAYALLQWPWRATLADHLYSFAHYGTRPYEYVNLAVPGLSRAYASRRYGTVIWHNSVMSWLRWSPESQHGGVRRRALTLRGAAPRHVALPQDEFLHSDRINGFLNEIGVDHVFSVAPPSEWPKIYDGIDRERVGISRVLTGYLDDDTVARIDALLGEGRERTIDIGYRTVPGKPYLGRHAALKADIAEAVRERAVARGLRVDVSTRAEDTFYGDDWYRFLASCRYTIGIEGGASVLDRDGSVRACVDGRLAERADATFEELEASCFLGRDGELSLFAISPRHLEACATRTAQILVEGEYNGILAPGEHYLELRRDLSNLDTVLDAVADDRDAAAGMAAHAHAAVVASGRFTYRRLVEDVERELPPSPDRRRTTAGTVASRAIDTASRPLVPLATQALMPARRRLLGALGSAEYQRDGTPSGGSPRHVGGILVLYHRPIAPLFRDAATVVEHAFSFGEHSRLGVVELNTHAGLPSALRGVTFDAVILHYSLFGMAAYMLDDDFLEYVRQTNAYKVAFFQDEYIGCERRFAFLNEYGIDCVYTCLEPHQFDAVYGTYTSVPRIRPTLTGYVSDELRRAAARFGKPDAQRTVDVGYRGRPLPAYLGRGGQEKDIIGQRFRELAQGTGLRLDIKGKEADRLYGDAWHRFVANCRCVLGVESGASAFDLEGEVMAEYREFLARGITPGVEDLRTLDRWDGNVDLRTISPRHFEAAALRVCQVMFEGRYAGAMEPMRHYIPLRKDFSNFDEVVGLLRDPDVRRDLTDAAHRDLIASGDYDYAPFVRGVDDDLEAAGVGPLRDRELAERAVHGGRRMRHLRSHVRGGLPELLRAEPAKRLMYAAEPVTLRVRKLIRRPRPTGLPD